MAAFNIEFWILLDAWKKPFVSMLQIQPPARDVQTHIPTLKTAPSLVG
jgi:hypothetical protein